MKWLTRLARPNILALSPYRSARTEQSDSRGFIQLDANENPYPPYPEETISEGLNRYPAPQSNRLLTKLGSLYGVSSDHLLATRGMDEGIDLLIRAFCVPGKDAILILPPTFGYYAVAAAISDVRVKEYPLSPPTFQCTPDALCAAWTPDIKILFLCSPNNPTGHTLSREDITTLCTRLEGEALVALDEAYIEFAATASLTEVLAAHPNLVVMRTLSKAYGLAGARLGTVIAHPEIISLLRKILPPYPIPRPTEHAALKALSPIALAFAKKRIDEIKHERARIEKELATIPEITVYPSQANFVLIHAHDAEKVQKKLFESGIIIRNRSADLPNTLRLTIGRPEENDLLLRLLKGEAAVPIFSRRAFVTRQTKETEIAVEVVLDLPLKTSSSLASPVITTGIGFFDHMLEQLSKHGGFQLDIKCQGDLHIDSHHTIEDVAIVLGQALRQALGDRKGIQRYAFTLPMDETLATVALDLSGRGHLEFQGTFATPLLGEFPTEMVSHFFSTFAHALGAAIHIHVQGRNTHHMIEACFKACGKALGQAFLQTGTAIPSTKGVL